MMARLIHPKNPAKSSNDDANQTCDATTAAIANTPMIAAATR